MLGTSSQVKVERERRRGDSQNDTGVICKEKQFVWHIKLFKSEH
jgi:hypothetical protein